MSSAINPAHTAKLLRVMLVTLMLSSMSAMMFNIVLPELSLEFNLSLAQVSWMSAAYSLIYAVGTVTYGKLADRFKLKNIVTFGLLVFAAGSIIGLLSQSFGMALLARCLQSVGAASIPAVSMLIPIRYIAQERRGAALGMAAAGLALGSAFGPVLSALLTSFADWRWLFSFPIALLALIPFYRSYLPDDTGAKSIFDWLGGILLGAAAGLVLFGFTNVSWLSLGLGLIFLALFVWRIRSAAEPFVRPELFRNRKYSFMILVAVVVNGIGVSFYFLTPVLLSRVQALPPYWIGMVMVPAAIVSAILGRKAGKLADRKGNAFLYTIASASIIIGFVLLSSFAAAPGWWIAVILILGNVGQSFMMITMSNTVSQTLPKEQAGVGMGLFSMCGFITHGMASGLYGIIAEWTAETSVNPIHQDSGSAVFSNLYLVLALLHVGVLVFYLAQFGSNRKLQAITTSSGNGAKS
ncbi:MFS transporter [Paenibacillus sp. 1011MAR3C5]|uniref:MFS transporter n=1 Tax=Paenibacillus sp. 1011MAR3C5 TaxID=1675787 RepID=UPI000E6CFD5D|nr:MFS transporter [Paenibacillus sp. 1011MAR3C5]RJE89710.1 MFS transporter [Paenibacillus sp. 1011MAR3C5]